MRVALFSTRSYDRAFFTEAGRQHEHELVFFEARLSEQTCGLAEGFEGVCVFVNDRVTDSVLQRLSTGGTRIVALRCAGFNNVALPAARSLGICVVRVPAYSPHAVAEHTAALILTLNRRIHRAHWRVREGNFALDGLLGFDLHGRTVGVIGTGRIGRVFSRIMAGFGCRVLAYDPQPSPEVEALGARYVTLSELFADAHMISLHCPLTPDTYHLVNAGAIEQMRHDVMIVNTSRGAVIDTRAVVAALKSDRIGSLGIDVYEEEGDYFFEDLSNRVIADDVLARLLTFHNVIITGHQAFFTKEAMETIALTTLRNLTEFEQTGQCSHSVA